MTENITVENADKFSIGFMSKMFSIIEEFDEMPKTSDIITEMFVELSPVFMKLKQENGMKYIDNINNEAIIIHSKYKGFRESKKVLLQGGFIKLLILHEEILDSVKNQSVATAATISEKDRAHQIHIDLRGYINQSIKECVSIYNKNIRALNPELEVIEDQEIIRSFRNSIDSVKSHYKGEKPIVDLLFDLYTYMNKPAQRLIRSGLNRRNVTNIFKTIK